MLADGILCIDLGYVAVILLNCLGYQGSGQWGRSCEFLTEKEKESQGKQFVLIHRVAYLFQLGFLRLLIFSSFGGLSVELFRCKLVRFVSIHDPSPFEQHMEHY